MLIEFEIKGNSRDLKLRERATLYLCNYIMRLRPFGLWPKGGALWQGHNSSINQIRHKIRRRCCWIWSNGSTNLTCKYRKYGSRGWQGHCEPHSDQRPQCMGNLMVYFMGIIWWKLELPYLFIFFLNEMKGEIYSKRSCTECK